MAPSSLWLADGVPDAPAERPEQEYLGMVEGKL
jgi:hypothetical protein